MSAPSSFVTLSWFAFCPCNSSVSFAGPLFSALSVSTDTHQDLVPTKTLLFPLYLLSQESHWLPRIQLSFYDNDSQMIFLSHPYPEHLTYHMTFNTSETKVIFPLLLPSLYWFNRTWNLCLIWTPPSLTPYLISSSSVNFTFHDCLKRSHLSIPNYSCPLLPDLLEF